MKDAGKLAIGVPVLVVGGLVALAPPTMAAMHGEVSSWAVFAPATNPTDPPASEDDPGAEKMRDELGKGYTYVGNGTAIPKSAPETAPA